ncbi:hypothetical protein PR202_ga26619 [Eleusine coracana subsp. coracana]|uniref:TF-B3 domain-containing protein n=1 Tax=Eleusine coracana subsp. coracana TaxID=191504 RepID=A0AAV5DEK2_ELECO|nr:hypothetical protein PR202_ga26619 [Eleusine coracana subsp. coracana]
MEQGMADLRLGDFEFFKILLPGMAKNKLRLPSKFAEVLGERRELKMRLASAGAMAMPLWDVELVSGGDGVYLGRGWRQFARTYDLGEGHTLVFRYDTAAVLTVTVFDPSTCRKHYPQGAGTYELEAPGGNAPHINEPAHFAVTLRKCNLGAKQNQYLNVPVEFQDAHGYARRRQVVLRMGGRSWTFCVDNGLEVGDTCFFRVVRERKEECKEEEDHEEWEEEEEDDEHVLKVEVRKKDGAFVA